VIRVTVELLPGGFEEMKETLGVAEIANDVQESLESDGERGSYTVELLKWGKGRRVWKKGRVTGFRRRSRGPWDLLLLALLDTVADRNKQHVREACPAHTEDKGEGRA